MDRDTIISEIDQLHGEAISTFGADSATAAAFKRLYHVACKEAKEFDETAPSDAYEYRAAHANQQRNEARAINAGRY